MIFLSLPLGFPQNTPLASWTNDGALPFLNSFLYEKAAVWEHISAAKLMISLLVTHIIDGSFTFVVKGRHITARQGDTVLLDCFHPHEYYTNDSFESIWVHFNGPIASTGITKSSATKGI